MKINRILSGTFSTENLYKIFNWIYSTFWTCDFVLKTNTKCFHWKSCDFCQHNFPTENQYKIFHRSKRFHAFGLVDQRHFSIDFATYLKLLFCIENQWRFLSWKSIDLPASKTSGFPFIFYIEIFMYIFLLILSYFWNCHFILKTNTNFSCGHLH